MLNFTRNLTLLLSIWLVGAAEQVLSSQLALFGSNPPKPSRIRTRDSTAFSPPLVLKPTEISKSVLSPQALRSTSSRALPPKQSQFSMQLDPGTAAFLCGSIAGVTSSFAVFPVDTAKTKMQTAVTEADKGKYASVYKSICEVFHDSGTSGLFRGCGPALLGSAPEAAIQMTAHDTTYNMLASMPNAPGVLFLQLIAGAAAGFCTILVTNPLEVLKIRGQTTEGGEADEGLCAAVEELGLAGLFEGCYATWLRDIPFYASYFPVYEASKGVLGQPLLAGLLAGVMATLLTTPADLIKTRIQAKALDGKQGSQGSRGPAKAKAQGKGQGYERRLLGDPARRWAGPSWRVAYSDRAAWQWSKAGEGLEVPKAVRGLQRWAEEGRRLVSAHGWSGLYTGCSANVARKGAAMAISLSVYEALQGALAGGLGMSAAGQDVAIAGSAETAMAELAVDAPAVIDAVGMVGQVATSAAAAALL